MNKISPIKERILLYIDYKGITKAEFCKTTNISYANIKGASLQSEIGGSQIAEILTSFDEISPDWLLTGRGEMLKTPSKTSEISPSNFTEMLKIIANQQETIRELATKNVANATCADVG